jgi:hypothetical protein
VTDFSHSLHYLLLQRPIHFHLIFLLVLIPVPIPTKPGRVEPIPHSAFTLADTTLLILPFFLN